MRLCWAPLTEDDGRAQQLVEARRDIGAALSLTIGPARGEIVVGVVVSQSGPVSSIGIPYGRGINAGYAYVSETGGEKIRIIQLEDGSDPSTATKNARKLIEEDKVDILLGTAGAPATAAMIGVATEQRVPMIALSPVPSVQKVDGIAWAISVPQPPSLMVGALINPDFVRLAGKSAEGLIASTGPIMVLDQLPDDHPNKKIGLAFKEAHLKANDVPSNDGFSAYSFDAWLIFVDAAKRALARAKPGTSQFRTALREAIYSTSDLVGTHGVYNYRPESHWGTDKRALVLVRLEQGQWKLFK